MVRLESELAALAVGSSDLLSHEPQLRMLALDLHREARALGGSTEAAARYALADRAYALYFRHFDGHPHSTEVRYAYAELLYKLKRYDAAYTHYMDVVAADPAGRRARFCAESAVHAAKAQLKLERSAGRASLPERGSLDPVGPSPWDDKLQAALAQYIEAWPADPKVQSLAYASAWNHYELNQFDAAAPVFERAIAAEPSTRIAEQAANLVLDSFVLRKDYVGLLDFANALLAIDGLGSPAFRAELRIIRQRAAEAATAREQGPAPIEE